MDENAKKNDPNYHKWPADGEHLWGPWYAERGLPKPTQYRQCVHPQCDGVEYRKAPQAS